jgi:hypothetical protein
MAERLRGQCDRCVFLKENHYIKFFFCDAQGYPVLARYSDNLVEHDTDPIGTLGSCACYDCIECHALCHTWGLIPKTLADELCEGSHGGSMRRALRELRRGQ